MSVEPAELMEKKYATSSTESWKQVNHMKAASAAGELSNVTRTLEFKEQQNEITKWIDRQRPVGFKMRRGNREKRRPP